MTTETMKIKVLYPSKNYFLYNAEAKTISDKVFLGIDANEDDWQEITADEKEALEKEWRKEAEKIIESEEKMHNVI